MQMAGHILSALLVAIHRQGLHREDLRRQQPHPEQAGLLPDLPQRHLRQILIAVGMAAQP